MKGQAMIAVIRKRFSRICRLAEKIILQFDAEDIHQFRVEIKKLRAFLRLLCASSKNGSRPALKKRMKKTYSEMGRMRNLQLVQARLAACGDVTGNLLRPALGKTRKKLATLLKDGRTCQKAEQRLEAAIPEKEGWAAIESYVDEKSNTLRALLNAPSHKDDSLHLLRKLLKDIVYNWPFIEPAAVGRLPAGLNSPETIKPLAALLGDFQDAVTGLALLHKTRSGGKPYAPGQAALQSAITTFESEKKALCESIYRSLKTIRDRDKRSSSLTDAPAHKKDQ